MASSISSHTISLPHHSPLPLPTSLLFPTSVYLSHRYHSPPPTFIMSLSLSLHAFLPSPNFTSPSSIPTSHQSPFHLHLHLLPSLPPSLPPSHHPLHSYSSPFLSTPNTSSKRHTTKHQLVHPM